MDKKAKNTLAIVAILVVAAAAVFLYQKNQRNQPQELAPKEIRNYEGKNLSSVDDFRENSIKGPQYVDKDSYQLKIKGMKDGALSYAYDDIIQNHSSYKKVVTLDCVEGWSVTILWEGVLVKDLFEKNLLPPEANTIIFRAYDGYSTSFPLSYILDNDILIAYKINEEELSPERGFPFQLVAEDKWGYKWIKWITEIEFSSDSSYRGYWESRGYSNSGDLDKNFLGR